MRGVARGHHLPLWAILQSRQPYTERIDPMALLDLLDHLSDVFGFMLIDERMESRLGALAKFLKFRGQD